MPGRKLKASSFTNSLKLVQFEEYPAMSLKIFGSPSKEVLEKWQTIAKKAFW